MIQSQVCVDAISLLQPQIYDPQVTMKPGINPYWIKMSGYFGPQGGTLSCDQSDVVLEVPPGAIPASHPRQLITVKVSLTPSIFSVEVEKGGLFLSPLVDCESPGLKIFKKDVTIKLPHRAHLRPDWQFLVHYTDDSLLAGDRGTGWRVVKSSCQNARRDMQNATPANFSRLLDVQFTVDTKYVYITTPHFSKYTCSGCGRYASCPSKRLYTFMKFLLMGFESCKGRGKFYCRHDCIMDLVDRTGKEMDAGFRETFIALSNKLTANQWKPILRTLMLGSSMDVDAEISSIEVKYPNDLKEQIYNGLMEWYRMCGKDATIQKLCESLENGGLESVAEEINDTYRQASVQVRAQPKLDNRCSDSLETTVVGFSSISIR
ncbi:uncharacterized protein [Amphiura filiformis]|uniref:uncharacterized protein n=1 Tax=Amphiura filiformis TaxID=82378 RepID=UPI003B228315